MIRLLSHPLSPLSPVFPGTAPAVFVEDFRIARGDIDNEITFTTQNHASTHVEGPWHFNPHGKRITELDLEEFFFNKARIVDIPKGDDEVITVRDLKAHADEIVDADLLLVRTGYGARYRTEDAKRYSAHGPGFDASAGHYLITEQPTVRAIAMDFISAVCQKYLDEGMEFHRIVLGQSANDRYILIIEDARIDDDLEQADLGRVIVSPLLLDGQDAGPATIFAESAPS